MNKSDLSQYVSGKAAPNQDKLFILGKALNVNESWLMGHDVPMQRQILSSTNVELNDILFEISPRSLEHSPKIKQEILNAVLKVLQTDLVDTKFMYNLTHNKLTDEALCYFFNSIIEYVIYNTKTDTLSIFFYIDKKGNNVSNANNKESIVKNIALLTPENTDKTNLYIKSLLQVQQLETSGAEILNAAHSIKGASNEDKMHDDDIMNDDNF